MPAERIGWIVCLPSSALRDKAKKAIQKIAQECDEGYLGPIGSAIFDRDCEIITITKSKNFGGFNITAKVDNMMAAWFTKYEPMLGPAVIRTAKIKDHGTHWSLNYSETRLNYVKVFQ